MVLSHSEYLSTLPSGSHSGSWSSSEHRWHEAGQGRTWLLLRLTPYIYKPLEYTAATSQRFFCSCVPVALEFHRPVSVGSLEVLYIRFWPAHPVRWSLFALPGLQFTRNFAQRRKIIGLSCSFSNCFFSSVSVLGPAREGIFCALR